MSHYLTSISCKNKPNLKLRPKNRDKFVNRRESKRIHFTSCRLRKPLPSIKSCASTLLPFLNLATLQINPFFLTSSPATSGGLNPHPLPQMKRPIEAEDSKMMKKVRVELGSVVDEGGGGDVGVMQNLNENMLFEVLKHVDARTLAAASCVSKLWHRTAQDERLWEMICTRHWANIGCGNQQLRSVVLALGGFRRLHSLYLVPLSKPQSSSDSGSPSAWPTAPAPLPPMISAKTPARWGKDEVHLSLSLLSIRYYEKMNFNSRGR